MAITQTGSKQQINVGSNANAGTVSSTITVPADAELVIVTVAMYQGTANGLAAMTFTKGGADTAMSRNTGGDVNGGVTQGCIFWLALPDTGTNKSLKWDWIGTGTSGDTTMLFTVSFWKGVDTSSPVRSHGGGQGSSFVAPPWTTSASLSWVTGDLVFAHAHSSVSAEQTPTITWTGAGLTTLWQDAAYSSYDGAAATGSPTTGSGTIQITTASGFTDGGISAIVLKPVAAVTGKPVKVWNGSAWVTKTLKVWNGSAWMAKPVKVWNGSAWV